MPEELTNLFFCKIDVKYKVTCKKSPRTFEHKGDVIELVKEHEDRYLFSVTVYK